MHFTINISPHMTRNCTGVIVIGLFMLVLSHCWLKVSFLHQETVDTMTRTWKYWHECEHHACLSTTLELAICQACQACVHTVCALVTETWKFVRSCSFPIYTGWCCQDHTRCSNIDISLVSTNLVLLPFTGWIHPWLQHQDHQKSIWKKKSIQQ